MLEAAAMNRSVPYLGALALLFAWPAAAQQGTAVELGTFPLASPGTSPWEVVTGGRIRLVATPAAPDGKASAAIEIELEPGFKTYWWNPGPDGIPPQVSFFGSQNVKKTDLSLPPPHVFREKSVTVGYKGRVAFPIAVAVTDPARPYRLKALGTFGFCADICVPVPFVLQASPPPSAAASSHVASVSQQLLEPSETMRLDAARFDPVSSKMHVEATVPDTDVLLELVVANPDDRILPAAAETVHQKGDRATFTFDLDGEQAPKDGEHLRFTLIVGQFGQVGRIGVEQALPVTRVE